MFSFSNCQNLIKLIIPSSIQEIPYCCFEHWSNLEEVEFIGGSAFEYTNIEEANLGNIYQLMSKMNQEYAMKTYQE